MGNSKSLEDYDDLDLLEELDSRDYEFIHEVDDSEMVEYLRDVGYTVFEGDERDESGLDYIDQKRLEEITELFLKGSFQEREEIYNKITK